LELYGTEYQYSNLAKHRLQAPWWWFNQNRNM